jgi:hypothetical protein
VIGYYTLGKNQFALSYEATQYDDNASSPAAGLDSDTITLQALHNLSDNMYVYFEGYLGGGDEVYIYDADGAADSVAEAIGVTDERAIASVGAVYYL